MKKVYYKNYGSNGLIKYSELLMTAWRVKYESWQRTEHVSPLTWCGRLPQMENDV